MSEVESTTTTVMQAAQVAAGSIGTIDLQVSAVAGLPPVDPSVLPTLQADLDALKATLGSWPTTLRPLATNSLRAALAVDTAAIAEWRNVDRQDRGALLGYLDTLRDAVGTSSADIDPLTTAIAPFRAAVDSAVSTLRTDVNQLTTIMSAQAQSVRSLQAHIAEQQRVVDRYNNMSLGEAFLWGMTIVGGFLKIMEAQDAEKATRTTLKHVSELQARVQHLHDTIGPLLTLSTALAVLSGSLLNVESAVQQVSSTLRDVTTTAVLPPILAAQIEAEITDLQAADRVIEDVLADS